MPCQPVAEWECQGQGTQCGTGVPIKALALKLDFGQRQPLTLPGWSGLQ